MIDLDIQQRSLDWFRERLGNITGSKVSVLMSSGRKKGELFSQTGKTYLYQLAAERMMDPAIVGDDDMFGQYIDLTTSTTKAMQFGIDNEDDAKRLFMDKYFPDKELLEAGSCAHATIPHFASSPDGLIRKFDADCNMADIEVKCPNISNYMLYRTEIHDAKSLKAVKPEYYWQMQAEMDCTETVCGFFICYCPWVTEPLHVAMIARQDDDIRQMEDKVRAANEYIDNIIRGGHELEG